MANWFVNLQGFEIGPISDAELQDLVATKKLAADGSVRREDQSKWTVARKVPGLFSQQPPVATAAAASPPAVPVVTDSASTGNAFPPPVFGGSAEPPVVAEPVVAEPSVAAEPPMAKPVERQRSGKIRPMLTRCTHSGCRRYMLAAEFHAREVITCLICNRPFQAVAVKSE